MKYLENGLKKQRQKLGNNNDLIFIVLTVILLNILLNIFNAQLFKITITIIFTLIVLFFFNKRILLYYFIVCITTEYCYIEIAGGILRPYHIVTLLYLIYFLPKLKKIIKSNVLKSFMLFFSFGIISILMTDLSIKAGFTSLVLLLLNFIISIIIYILLHEKKININKYTNEFMIVVMVTILWGYIQISAKYFLGLNLALSEQQISQISINLIPSFRTESNTYGKFIITCLAFIIPFIPYEKPKKKVALNMVLISLLNFTRSSTYGIILAFIVKIMVSFKIKKIKKIFKVITLIILVFSSLSLFTHLGILDEKNYGIQKINKIFKLNEISTDESASYRMNAMEIGLNKTLESKKKIIIGNGWGQVRTKINDKIVEPGGGDLLSVFMFNGLIGVFIYLGIYVYIFFNNYKLLKKRKRRNIDLFGEGSLLMLLTIFFTGNMAGMIITPIYWVAFGQIAYIDTLKTRRRK